MSPGEAAARDEAEARHREHRRIWVRARFLARWGSVEVERIPQTTPDAHQVYLANVHEAVRARAEVVLGCHKPLFACRDWRAQNLARKLDLRFLDNQRFVAAVLAAETLMAPAKALRLVQEGRWWMTPRWRSWTQ